MFTFERTITFNQVTIKAWGRSLLLIILFLSFLIPEQVIAQQTETDNISVIFVIDDSGSMETNDPQNLRITAAKLFIALLDPGDGAAIITFADDSQINSHFTTIQGYEDKLGLINSLGDIQSEGYTNMKAAFEDVVEVLDEDLTGNQKYIVFLTDGNPQMPDGLPPGYEDETLGLISQGNTPVMSIGLTMSGLTSFLGRVPEAAGQGSQIVLAKSANDLLDVYMGILGRLKDRTTIGEGTIGVPGSVNLPIEPMLSEYVDSVSFIAIHSFNAQANLTTPTGDVITSDESIFSETFDDVDPNFTVMTMPSPSGGDWQMDLQGSGTAQARAILRSRLRVKIIEPGHLFPLGEPMPIKTNLILEENQLQSTKIIGDATFSALIERPDGARDSLDLLYDDGTHGDILAGDGDFTNSYVNTDIPGTYVITIVGHKGVIPVSSRTVVEIIDFPDIHIDSPAETRYEIRNDPVPLQIHLDEFGENSYFEGNFIAKIQSPAGNVIEVHMFQEDSYYKGMYTPTEDGTYLVEFESMDAYFQGLPYVGSTQIAFEADVVPNLIVQNISMGLGEVAGQNRFEVVEALEGIPVSVSIESNSDQPEEIMAHLEQTPGFELRENDTQIIPPNSQTIFTFHIIGDDLIKAGSWDGKIILTPVGQVDVLNNQPSLNFEVYEPEIMITTQVISQVASGNCMSSDPIKVILNSNSNSIKPESIDLQLLGVPGSTLSQNSIEIQPGISDIELMISSDEGFSAGEYDGTISYVNYRAGLIVEPESGQLITFVVEPIWVTCRRPMIILGIGLIMLVIFGAIITRKWWKGVQPAIASGIFTYWPTNSPRDEEVADLSSFNQTEITIGSSQECTITIIDEDIETIHAKIVAEKIEGEEPRMILDPFGTVRVGYREIKDQNELVEGVDYTIGNHTFSYIRNPF